MKILSVGVSIPALGVDSTSLESYTSFLDYDVLIYDAFPYLKNALGVEGKRYSSAEVKGVLGHLIRRQKEIDEFLRHGRLVIYFPFPAVPVQTLDGLGRGIVDEIPDVMNEGPKLVATMGNKISCAHGVDERIKRFFESLLPFLRYRTTLTQLNKDKPALVVTGTKKSVGIYTIEQVRLLNSPVWRLSNRVEAEIAVSAIIKLVGELTEVKSSYTLPESHKNFVLSGEQDLLKSIDEQKLTLKKLMLKVQEDEFGLSEFQNQKRLFLAKDQALVDAVAAALSELGVQISAGPKTKDDLIGQYNSMPIVIEVKGRDTKGAAERDAQQLEKWVSDYALEHQGKAPKGILVINGYKEIPVDQRIEAVFPDAMVKYSVKRDHCLISGLQLLCLCMQSRHSPAAKEKAVESLLNCVGVFPNYLDDSWKQVLTVASGDKVK